MTVKEMVSDVMTQMQQLSEAMVCNDINTIYGERVIADLSNHLVISYLALCRMTHDKQLKRRLSNKIDNLLNKIAIIKSEE